MVRAILVTLVLLFAVISSGEQSTRAAAEPMVLDPATLKVPTTCPAEGFKADGVTAVYIDSVPYKGKPTRVFAWYGIPKVVPGAKVPAMVLVHGGGGTAFAHWVKVWVDRGYAAIAVDTCGQVPNKLDGKWQRHEMGGPAGWGGLTTNEIDLPQSDQWTYHAISAVAVSHSLIASLPEVDAERVGVTGVSWGGYLACISAGVDRRYKLAVPVYGCGFLGDSSVWVDSFRKMGPDHAGRWLAMWDPSRYLPAVKRPMLWVTGTNDFAYPMDSYQKSYRQPTGPRTLCIKVRMGHGHGPMSEQVPEIFTFVDSVFRNGAPLAAVNGISVDGKVVSARFDTNVPIVKAEIVYTADTGPWQKRLWRIAMAEVDAKARTVSGVVPADARVCYLNLTDVRGLTISTEHIDIAAPIPAGHGNEAKRPTCGRPGAMPGIWVDEGRARHGRRDASVCAHRFKGVLVLDHTPVVTSAAPWDAGMAYALRYMRGCLQSVVSANAKT